MTLEDASYLLSSIQTIADSLQEQSPVSIHDLLDAYATFSSRLRSHSQHLETCNALPPALNPLETYNYNFIQALRRDVHLAHVDPLSLLPRSPSALQHSLSVNVDRDGKQYVRDSSSLCHQALCTLATILRCPTFHLVFSEHDITILFRDVLDIALADRLPVFNAAKTYSLSLWILGCHRLPINAVTSCQERILSALQRCLDEITHPCDVVLDGLKALSHAIEYYPSAFLDLLSPLLPHVLRILHCESSELYLQASVVLAKFANALIHQTELSMTKWQVISGHTTSFLGCGGSLANFLRMARTAFSTEPYTPPGYAPTWMLAILASLIVLCGPALYTKPVVLQLILQALAMALTHDRSIVRALHPHVWNCFIWTFSRMLLDARNVEPALIFSAFYVIKQEVGGGIGAALVSVLLSDRMSATLRGNRVPWALSVVKAMGRTECDHTRREAFILLQALTDHAAIGPEILRDTYEIPASVLVNGAIIGAERDRLPAIIRSISRVPVSVSRLEKTEITQHWKILLEIWKHLAIREDRKELDSVLVDTWFTILLVCSHHPECEQHDNMTIEISRYAAAIIIEFLPSVVVCYWEPDWGSWDVHDQLRSLTFINQLWATMRKAFAPISLTEAAELILLSILKYAFHVLDPGVRKTWGRLCASLMTTASPSFLQDVREPTESQLVIRSQRELWGVVAASSSPELGLSQEELLGFLAIPICTWVLSKPELEAWKALFRTVLALSEDSAAVIEHFVLQYFQGEEVDTWESIMLVLGFLLACTQEHGGSPADELLSMVDICLTASYGRAHHSPEILTYSLELLKVIRHMIASNVSNILRALSSSLCIWIEDHDEIMSDDEFNSVAVSLYCEVLEALKFLPLSTKSLQDTENFLASAFSRIPPPAIAPFAFEKYWRATYHGRTQFYEALPPKIESSLACFVAAYGGDLADGLLLTIESQTQSITNDSQVNILTNHQHQYTGELSLQFSASMIAEVLAQISDTEDTRQQLLTSQEDTTCLIPSLDCGTPQPTVLRQLQEYSSHVETSSLDGLERSASSPRILLSPIFSPPAAILSSPFPKEGDSVTPRVPNPKRKLADNGNVPQKRSRTSRDTLRSIRELASEPASRDLTPIGVPRMHSLPPKKKRTFDGVHVPTLREVVRRRRGAHTISPVDGGRRFMSIPQSPLAYGARERGRTPPSVVSSPMGSYEDDLDWENLRVHMSLSEADVDQSLSDTFANSPPRTSPISVLHDLDDDTHPPPETSARRAMSQTEGSPSAPHPSLRRAKTSARLEALRDLYSSVADGASQISMDELLQATRLVHQIGTVLTEQMGKKMGDPG